MDTKERKVFHSRPLFYGFLALLLAIATSRFIFAGNLQYILFVSFVLVAFVVYCIWLKRWKSLISITIIFLFGLGWFFVGQATFVGKDYKGNCQIVGRISDNVTYSVYGNSASVVLEDVYINGNKEKNIDLTIYIEDETDFAIGDIVAFESEVEKVSLFTLGNFNSFYYRDGTAYTSSVSASNFFVKGNRLTFDETVRQKMKSVLYDSMGEENGAVAFAVLFGDKSEVDDDIYNSYKTAGVIHLLTVSGLHVGFLITLIGFILKKCKVKGVYNFIISAVFLGLYAYLCGFAPSVMRAGIMGLMLLGAKLSGKCYDKLNTLGFAGILILLYSPLSALDVGFLMSFFCVLGIFVVSPWLTKLFGKAFPKLITSSFGISLGAQIGILPSMALIYSKLNVLTVFVNLIVIPIFSIIFPILFLSVFIVALLPFMGFLLKFCGLGLDLVYIISDFFGNTNLILGLEPLNIFLVGLGFVLLFFISKYFMASKKLKTICCSTLVALCSVVCIVLNVPVSKNSSIVYGYNYSNAIVILTNKDNKTIIIDPGYENFTKNLMSAQNVKSVETAFVLQKSSANIETVRNIGVVNLIRCGSQEGFDEEIVVEKNESGQIGGFSFVYRFYDNKLQGLEICFDNVKVFVLRNIKQSAEGLQILSQENYDFVILGKKDEYSSYFKNSNLLTYYENEDAKTSFVGDGNVCCEIVGQKYSWRCLD